MRELKRSIARHLMQMNGIEQINKPKFDRPRKPGKYDVPNARPDARKASYFALHWKEYLDPESSPRKALHKALRRREALNARLYGKPDLHPWPIR